MNIINDLTEVLRARKDADPGSSYVASLYHKGLNGILQKVGEETTETMLAAKDAADRITAMSKANAQGAPLEELRNDALVHEVADLWFHTLVMLVHLNQDPQWVLDALADRFGISGHEEKDQRGG